MTDLPENTAIRVEGVGFVDNVLVLQGPTGAQGPPGDVPGTRQIATGTGLTGGGDLSADRTLAVAFGTTNTTVARGNRGLPAGGTTGQVPIKGSNTDYDVAWGTVASGGSAPITQVFDASGTWTKPAGAKRVRVILIGAGAPGAAAGSGGIAGGGGALLDLLLDATELDSSVSVTVGVSGGNTSITLANGSVAEARGGTTAGVGGAALLGGVALASGATGATVSTNAYGGGVSVAGGGAGNASSTIASSTSYAGGGGGRTTGTGAGTPGGGAAGRSKPGISSALAGQDGDVKTARAGGGGYYSASGAAGAGGKYGGGGGGTGSGTPGAGGQGGVCFITYFD